MKHHALLILGKLENWKVMFVPGVDVLTTFLTGLIGVGNSNVDTLRQFVPVL